MEEVVVSYSSKDKVGEDMTTLRQEEVQLLSEHFKYYNPKADDHETPLDIVYGEELFTKEGLQTLLDKLHVYWTSEDKLATASMFTKRIGIYMVTTYLVPMTLFSKMPGLDSEGIKMIRLDENSLWFPKWKNDNALNSVQGDQDREEWVKEQVTLLIQEMILPLFQNVHHITKLPMTTMWENLAIYIYWFYEQYYSKIANDEIQTQAQEDFKVIKDDLSGDIFQSKRNPLAQLQYQPCQPDGAHMRKLCCLTYRMNDDSKYCRTCPNRP